MVRCLRLEGWKVCRRRDAPKTGPGEAHVVSDHTLVARHSADRGSCDRRPYRDDVGSGRRGPEDAAIRSKRADYTGQIARVYGCIRTAVADRGRTEDRACVGAPADRSLYVDNAVQTRTPSVRRGDQV